jgi:predicted AAA+ superfamily ATPase
VLGRKSHVVAIGRLFRSHPVVAILGPRQVGKTTLARLYASAAASDVQHFDLEDADDLGRLAEPMLALGALRGLTIIDEVQRRPELFSALRVLVDRPGAHQRFLVLGSASPDHELPGFSLDEVGKGALTKLWLRGGFPRSFLAKSEADSLDWRKSFVRTFLERDIPQLGLRLPAVTLRRFWTMVAHYHGQIWNASEIGASLALADTTVRRYLDLMTATFMVRQLAPWFENVGKRQVKSPKVYLTDSGLLHTLLGLPDLHALEAHPKLGFSWEGFLIEQVVQRLGAERDECFFWATHQGAELDLLVIRGGRRYGFEFKRTSAPTVTKSMRIAMEDLALHSLDVIHAGAHSFPMDKKIRAVAAGRLLLDLQPLR